ncbi:crotonobetaine/carnitine-CoA ligase [Hephaestia caeni]|uniref:Crotonobetaine/carnitine-CoA ligase n=1 Tax=Hephaestia caeni TaxID=645617 RepID=A0A397PIJ7_9SPHN|nr:AMP-binding protein [Hephaestia caeni]RIA45491.1 crotonobetaine/carnitine-CoA ligase [Hephaestia caeni]
MITDLLRTRAQERADAPFVVTHEQEYSYSAILDASERLAGLIETLGIGEGDNVGLIAGNSAAFLISWFGINLRGAVAVTLNNALIADGLNYSIEQANARVLIVDRAWEDSRAGQLNECQRALPRIVIDDDPSFFAMLQAHTRGQVVRVPPHAPCTILYTSGTTGLPKGVVNCHNAYDAAGRATIAALDISASDRIMVFLPLFHVNPQMYAVMSALHVGAAVIVLPKFSATQFFDDAVRFGATGCTFVGTVLAILVKRHPGVQRAHGLRFFFGGGASRTVWQQVEERFGIAVREVYGMTEAGGWTTANTVAHSRFGSCGKPRRDLEVKVVGPDDRPLPPNEIGEIVIRPVEPDTILTGYYDKPEQTVASLRNLWFHSGDLGSYDDDGYLYYHGRSKELIRKSGEMISPVEIETALRAIAAIEDCAVVAVPDEITGDEIKAIVVSHSLVDPRAILASLEGVLPAYMHPRYVEFRTSIPRTETEKIQRAKLQYLDERVWDALRDRITRAAP